MKKHISIADALCGFSFYLQHLDKHILKITIPKGMVIIPGSVYKVNNEGMPVYGRKNIFGDLIIQFTVDFPEELSLSDDQINILKSMFPGISNMQGSIPFEREVVVEKVSLHDHGVDDTHSIQCAQQ